MLHLPRACCLALALVGSAAVAAETPRPVVAVLDFEVSGATPLESEAVNASVARGLRELDVFQVLTSGDVRQLLAIERSRLLVGLSDQSSRVPFSEALGAKHVVAGTVRSQDGQVTAELRLLDTVNGKVVAQKVAGPAKLAEVVRAVKALAQELVSPLLDSEQGALLVRSSEPGAEIRVDDVLRGSTPLAKPIQMARGTHRLELRKDGFISQLTPVRIEPSQTRVEDVQLVPSPDYAEAYRQRHGRLRVGAWISTAVAVGALGGALVLDRTTDAAFQSEFLPRKLALSGGDTSKLSPAQYGVFQSCMTAQRATCSEQASALSSQLAVQQYLTWGLVGLGAIATGTASYLWLTGEDPNRYTKLVTGVSVGPGSATVALSGAF